jgi:hypothetical protein
VDSLDGSARIRLVDRTSSKCRRERRPPASLHLLLDERRFLRRDVSGGDPTFLELCRLDHDREVERFAGNEQHRRSGSIASRSPRPRHRSRLPRPARPLLPLRIWSLPVRKRP